jgi:hypothetical protein
MLDIDLHLRKKDEIGFLCECGCIHGVFFVPPALCCFIRTAISFSIYLYLLHSMTISVRRAMASDGPSVSQICLLTGDAGSSAEHLHTHGELPGLVYAVPYVKLPTCFGFVMEDDGEVVGYILGSTDTRVFEREAEDHWWPQLRLKYPTSGLTGLKEADKRLIKLIHPRLHPHV